MGQPTNISMILQGCKPVFFTSKNAWAEDASLDFQSLVALGGSNAEWLIIFGKFYWKYQ